MVTGAEARVIVPTILALFPNLRDFLILDEILENGERGCPLQLGSVIRLILNACRS